MEWRDEGIVLATRKHGETSAILEVMTARHGRHLGLVRGGRSRRMQPVLQSGNRVELSWRARLDEHLGSFQVEPIAMNAALLMASRPAVHGLQMLASHARLLPERDPHPAVYETLNIIIGHLEDSASAAELIVRFELLLLEELGFGLDLSTCAASGQRNDLAYVSPKSAQAVSRDAGQPWAERLLVLPEFLVAQPAMRADWPALEAAFRLTGYFLNRHVYEPRGTGDSDARNAFINAVRSDLAGKTISETLNE